MTFGLCTGLEEARAALDAGFDYVELPAFGFGGLEATWDDTPYAGLPIQATNLFFDPSLTLQDRDRDVYRAYVERTIERAASLGVSTMVVGSGRARRAPDEIDGEARFVAAAVDLQKIATPYGIVIAPESLNADETNVGVHLGRLSLALQGVGVGYTADSYHILREWERDRAVDLDGEWRAQVIFRPSHVHVGPMDRGMPRADDPMLEGFAAYLREEMAYDGRVSLEVNRGPDFDLAAANLALRALFA